MKKMMLAFFALLLGFSLCYGAEKPLVYKIPIKQEIHKASQRILDKGLKKAQELGADYIIIQINTYGGAMDAADSMRTALLHVKVPVIAFIDNQAASAGALISIACDSVYMSTGATFGSATVVDGGGNVLPDKYQSFMRSMMRATAEAHGKKWLVRNGDSVEVWHRDPAIAEAMVDPSIFIQGLIDSTKVLNFTTEEAIANYYCEGKAQSTEEVIAHLGLKEYRFEEYKPTFLDKVIGFFLLPLIQGLLLMAIIGGIYFELQSPGIGFPLGLAIVAAIFYFSPLYLEGMAEYWELLIVVAGLILIAVEVFVIPGFGVAGVSGIVLAMGGLILAMIDNTVFHASGPFNWGVVIKPVSVVIISSFASILGTIYFIHKFFPTRLFNRIALRTELTGGDGFVAVDTSLNVLVGATALVFADLKPVGKILIDNHLCEAMAEYGMISKGETVRITKVEGGRLYCEMI